MTPDQIQLLNTSWQMLRRVANETTGRFYERLFEVDPDTRRLFENTEMPVQQTKLARALETIVRSAGDAEGMASRLRAMGARHTGYGVDGSHYYSFASAMLWTLEQRLGEAWTPEMRDAWTAAIAGAVGAMMAGSSPAAA